MPRYCRWKRRRPTRSRARGHAHGRGHARVLEGSGGIHALVLGVELVDAEGFGGARKMVERRIAFAEGHRVAQAVEDG